MAGGEGAERGGGTGATKAAAASWRQEDARLLASIGGPAVTGELHLAREAKSLPVIARLATQAAKAAVQSSATHDANVLPGWGSLTTLALMATTVAVVIGTIIWLRAVLIPFVLAIFIMLLLEPLLFWFLNPLRMCAGCSTRARAWAQHAEEERRRVLRFPETPHDEPWHHGGQPAAAAPPMREPSGKCIDCYHTLWQVWSIGAVAGCIFVVLAVLALCTFLVVISVTGVNWSKYANSPRLKRLVALVQDMDGTPLQALANGPIKAIVNAIASVASTLFMMALFLAFLLFSAVGADPYTRVLGLGWKAKVSVQRYLRIKTGLSAIVGLLVWLVLSKLHIDLAFCFGFITFILNHIPHFGYAVSITLPLPLVLLDPTKDWSDFFACLIYPSIIHQVFSTAIEPRLVAFSLDLHPMVILASLAFWTLCWGAVGAVLATPLTCFVKMALSETDHPVAVFLAALLGGHGGEHWARAMKAWHLEHDKKSNNGGAPEVRKALTRQDSESSL